MVVARTLDRTVTLASVPLVALLLLVLVTRVAPPAPLLVLCLVELAVRVRHAADARAELAAARDIGRIDLVVLVGAALFLQGP